MRLIPKRLPLQLAGHLFASTPALSVTPSASVRASRSRSFAGQVMAIAYPDPIRTPAKAAHTGSVIILHGLGDSGAGWADIAQLWADDLPHVEFVFPTAPTRPVTLNGGMPMTAWHDIISLKAINTAYEEDAGGLLASAAYVESLVMAEDVAGIPPDRVVVAGFSQGGAIALLMLRRDVRLAGVVGLSTYLPLRSRRPLVAAANASTPVLCAHGTADEVVSWEIGEESYRLLKEEAGDSMEVEVIPGMGHEVWPPELSTVKAFLLRCLPSQEP